jgi:hypothetical protein
MARRISELENISEMDQTIRTSIFNPENPAACVSTSLRKHLKSKTRKDSYYLCENGTALKIVVFSKTLVSFPCFTNPRNL